MRNKIFGGIGILWGGALVLRWLMSGTPAAGSPLSSGQSGAAIFGALMLVAALYYFFRKPG